MARAAFGTPPEVAAPRLGALWRAMYEHVAALPDEEVAKGIEPLPGVLDTLLRLLWPYLLPSMPGCSTPCYTCYGYLYLLYPTYN